MSETIKAKPIQKFKFGAIDCAVWEQAGKDKEKFLTITNHRNYKDKDGKWQTTSQMRVNDLPVLILALQKAFEFAKTKADKTDE